MSSFLDSVKKLLRLHEGTRKKPYLDSVGKLTIGVGFNIEDVGLYDNEIDFILNNRVSMLEEDLKRQYKDYDTIHDPARKAVLLDMAYNLGVEKLLLFKNTLAAVSAGKWAEAADKMLVSKWARQVGKRANRLSNMMRTGAWPEDL